MKGSRNTQHAAPRTSEREDAWRIDRRHFLEVSAGALAALGLAGCALNPFGFAEAPVRFGVLTDAHYVDAEHAGSRYYRDTPAKMAECIARMNVEKVGFLIELGDFKDQQRPPLEATTLEALRRVEALFREFQGPRYHVLGNHDADSISKEQFLANIENTGIDPKASYYSFDSGALHGVVLDANFSADGSPYDRGNFDWTDANVPEAEIEWLERDLERTANPAIVFVHQLLDKDEKGSVHVNNAAQVRSVLSASGKVAAVFQGHHHSGDYSEVDGIHYYTLKALVEGKAPVNSYAIVELRPDGTLQIQGFGSAVSHDLTSEAFKR